MLAYGCVGAKLGSYDGGIFDCGWGMSRFVLMNSPGFKIALIFIVLAIVFLAVSIKNYLTTKGKTNPARQTWLKVSLIFAAVGVVLALMHIWGEENPTFFRSVLPQPVEAVSNGLNAKRRTSDEDLARDFPPI
jgi:hypothetical protein